ncbi:MAG: LPS assembly protein LptD [Gammaproteobacteria bacterium]
MTDRRIHALTLATLLMPVTHPGLADSPWDCKQPADAVWECISKASPAGAIEETPVNETNSMPVEETPEPPTTPAEPVTATAATLPTAASVQADAAAVLHTDSSTPASPTAPDSANAVIADPGDTAGESAVTEVADASIADPGDTVGESAGTEVTDAIIADPGDTAGESAGTEVTDAGITGPDQAVSDSAVADRNGDDPIPTVEEQRWSLCPPAPLPEHLAGIDDPDTVDLRADSIHVSSERIFTLSGDAVIRFGEQQLQAANIIYQRDSGELTARDGVRIAGPSLVVTADSALIETQAERGRLENIAFTVPGEHARGHASTLGFEGPTRQYLEKAAYTACPPGNRDWLLTAKKIELDQGKGRGVARNAKVTLKGVPLLYTPYLSFPLDDRRNSGLLFPKIGTTDEAGLDISLPWYWNIAPDRDMTLIPRLMSDRGVMLGGEFRYLTRRSSGRISGEYLAHDKKFSNQDRSLVSIQHRGNPVPRLATRVEASNVSDTSYFEDLGSTLVQTSQTSLERTAQATWFGDGWTAGITVQDFQNVDELITSPERPYKQLPQIVFSAAPDRRFFGLQASADAELNYFQHSDNSLLTGTRLDLTPRISLPLVRPGWFIRPTLGIRYTTYWLDNVAPGVETDPDRTLPIATLDMGTVFERTGSWSGRPYIQTLEPRLFYLYVPYKDQDNLPIFDTDNYDQNFWSLFRENRFSGPDRMGDANQLAVALSTRIMDPASGRLLLSASLGSLLYFRDRRVTLPGETVDTEDSSDLIGEVIVGLSRRWRGRAEMQWNPHTSKVVRNDYHLQYRAGPRRLLNLGYRYRDDIQEQADVSFLWPIGRAWHAVGRWYYDLDDSETIEALAGLGYERCCWGIQVLARSFINNDGQSRNNTVFVQLELKGLGKLGASVDDALERGILGYQATN